MTYLIAGIVCMDFDDLTGLNIKQDIDKKAFDDSLSNDKVCVSDYSEFMFKDTIGLCSNFSRDNKIITCDLMIYDINGFDTEMPAFVQEGLDTNAFKFRPVIKVLSINAEGKIIKAEMINLRLVI